MMTKNDTQTPTTTTLTFPERVLAILRKEETMERLKESMRTSKKVEGQQYRLLFENDSDMRSTLQLYVDCGYSAGVRLEDSETEGVLFSVRASTETTRSDALMRRLIKAVEKEAETWTLEAARKKVIERDMFFADIFRGLVGYVVDKEKLQASWTVDLVSQESHYLFNRADDEDGIHLIRDEDGCLTLKTVGYGEDKSILLDVDIEALKTDRFYVNKVAAEVRYILSCVKDNGELVASVPYPKEEEKSEDTKPNPHPMRTAGCVMHMLEPLVLKAIMDNPEASADEVFEDISKQPALSKEEVRGVFMKLREEFGGCGCGCGCR